MKNLYLSFLALAVFALPIKAQKTVVINEVMQSNIDYLMVDNDFPDSWVELYNTTDSPINIGGYYFGEKADVTKAWKLPSGSVVPAKGHFLIYCDKAATGVHTDFRVDAGKAHLYLLDKEGEVVDNLDMVEMPAANIAFGRVTDGAEEWQYEFAPTAGKPNAGTGVADAANVLPDPVFSTKGGLCSEPLTVTISLPEGAPEDAFIVYTKDGSEPSLQNREGIPAPRLNIEVNSTMVIRAKLITRSNSSLCGRAVTQSYIFHPRAVTMPVISLVSDRDYFYGSEKGILVANVNNGKPNYMQKWRRPVNVEYFDTLGNVVLNQLGETGVSGVSTREQPQKSMKIYTNKRFGKKNFKGHFWEDKPEVKKVKSFVVRCGGNESFNARINDAAVQKLFGTHVDSLDWQAYEPVIVYLNGNYIGEFGMRERSDDNYVESNYDGLEDVEVADEVSYQTPEKGSLFEDFYKAYHRSDVTFAELESMMDMDNFVKTVAAEIYAMNTDFPTNNVSLWRPLEEGGKWRWILKDMDRFGSNMSLYPESFDMLKYLFDPDLFLQYAGMHHFDLYVKMVQFPEFKDMLIDKMSVYLGDFLRPEVVNALVDSLDREIAAEVEPTFKMYNVKFSAFDEGTRFLKRIIGSRQNNLYSQMKSFFGLGDVVPMQIVRNEADVTVNEVPLTEGDFDGKYYVDRELRLGVNAKGCKWKVTLSFSDGSTDEKEAEGAAAALKLADYIPEGAKLSNVMIEPQVSNDNPQGDPTDGPQGDPEDLTEPDVPELALYIVK